MEQKKKHTKILNFFRVGWKEKKETKKRQEKRKVSVFSVVHNVGQGSAVEQILLLVLLPAA